MLTNKQLSTAAGLLAALASTNAVGQTSNWTNSSGGNWNDMGNWDASVPLSPGQSAVLGLSDPYTVTLDTNPDIDELSITNASALLSIPLARTLGLNGPASLNNGVIQINPNASSTNALLVFNGNTSLSGAGEIWMRTSSDNSQITGAGLLTHGAAHTIRGVGRIVAQVTNNGEIRADVGVSVSGSDLDLMANITNNGTLSAAGGSALDFVGIAIDQTGGGDIFSADGGLVNVTSADATITGGTISRAGTGEFDVLASGNATLIGVTNNGFIDVNLAGTASVDGTGLTNNGTVALNQSASASNSFLTFLSSGDLDGTGEVQMRTSSDNSQITTAESQTITHAASHTIRGVGRIPAAMVNNGTISADVGISVSGNDLDLMTENKTNNGDLTAEAGSFLDIIGITIDQLGGGDLIANGGTIRIDDVTIDGGSYSANSGGLLQNEVSSTSLLSGMTLNGPLNIRLSSTVQVDGDGMVNNDIIQLNNSASASNSNLVFTETATLGGSGEVQLRTGTDNSQVNTEPGAVLTLVPTQLIRGVGQVNAAMINNGEIRADASVSVSGSELDLQTNDKTNNNLIVSAVGSTLDIIGITIDQAGGGMLVADEGAITLRNATIEGGSYLGTGAGFLQNEAASTSLLSGVTLNGPSNIRLSSTVQVDADGLTNNGVMQINNSASASNSNLVFTDSTTLDGSGEIQMRTSADNSQINTDPTFTVTHGANHTIRGVGQINAAMVNNGVIRADSSISVSGSLLELLTNDKTNTAVMSVESASTLEVTGITLLQTGAGEIQANDGQVQFNGGATLSGGRIEATGTGNYSVNGPATFHEVTANAPGEVRLAQTLTISGDGLVNNELLRVNTSLSASDASIAFPANGFLNTAGGGEVNLTAAGGDSQIDGPGIVTNGPGHTISGRGTVDTELINGGIIAPGNDGIGTLNASGDVTFASFGSMTTEVGASNQSDRLAVSGTANLAGTLDVVLADSFVIGNQIDYTILTAGSVVGTFDTENLLVDGQLITRILYEPTQVRLVTRCIADTNLDGAVTPTDFTAWVNAFNNGDAVADQNLDGLITPTDFTAWIANFNMPCP